MKINLRPSDLVKRCVWDSYVYYIVGTDKDGKKLLEKDKEFEIPENDALVIGLLSVIETNNLIHKFNTHLVELLTNKSMKKKRLMIRKKTIDDAIDKYQNKFPDYWKPNEYWQDALKELDDYIKDIKEKVSKLEVVEYEDRNYTTHLYSSKAVKKLLKFNYS